MSEKKFQKKYMHPTRKKLLDMVMTGGEYETETKIGWTKAPDAKRKIGEEWEDEYNKYKQHKGFVMKTSKNSEAFDGVRDYLREKKQCKNTDCETISFGRVDKKLIKKSGYCLGCLSTIETEIRAKGMWKEYENYKIWTRMIIDGKLRLEQIQQAHDDAKQVYEYINEDGSIEKWEMPQSVEEVKAEMKVIIENGTKEIAQLEEMRIESFNKLTEKNLEHYV
jgi:transcription elongation factor Elf1